MQSILPLSLYGSLRIDMNHENNFLSSLNGIYRHFLIFNESSTSHSVSAFPEGSKHHPNPALNSVTYSKSSDSQSWKAPRSNALMSLSGDRGESCMLSPFQSLLTLRRLLLLLFSLTTKSIKQHQQPFRTTVLWEANAQKELISKELLC